MTPTARPGATCSRRRYTCCSTDSRRSRPAGYWPTIAVVGFLLQLPHGSVSAQAASFPAASTAFVHVNVIPMDHERVLKDQTVLVQGERIVTLGPAKQVPIPATALRIDGRGKYLIPGLADMHAHIGVSRPIPDSVAEQLLFCYVANGVTTIRMAGGNPQHLTLRARAARGELVSPRIYAAGPMFYAAPTPAEAAQLVAEQQAAGYDFLKWHADGNQAGFQAVVAESRRAGLPLMVDPGELTTNAIPLNEVLAAHVASIEHLGQYHEALLALSGAPVDSQWIHAQMLDSILLALARRADTTQIPRLARATQRARVWNVPTEIVWEVRLIQRAKGDPATAEAGRALIAINRQLIQALHAAGAGLLTGTDHPAALGARQGGRLVHKELAIFVAAGLTPYDALATSTRNVAEFLGTMDSTGTVAVGKRADLVLLEGNPLQDIRQTAQIAGVLLGGRWLAREALEARLATVDRALVQSVGDAYTPE